MDKLVKINHDFEGPLWCGAAALAATTGLPTSEITRALMCASHTKLTDVKGVSPWQMKSAAKILGYELVEMRRFEAKRLPPEQYGRQNQSGRYVYDDITTRPTLAAYARKHREDFKEYPVIVNVTNHFVTLYGRRGCDNHTKDVVFLTKMPFRRARVITVWQVIPRIEVWCSVTRRWKRRES